MYLIVCVHHPICVCTLIASVCALSDLWFGYVITSCFSHALMLLEGSIARV